MLVAALVGLQVLVAAPAEALPRGAYWYTTLDLPRAWQITKGAGVTVAVIDSGVKADLGDLRGQVLPGLDTSGRNPGARSDTAQPGEGNFGHGTDMAVLIAGTGRGAGMVGVAPKAKILPVDASSTTEIQTDAAARGITWAVDHGAKVINLSFGSPGPCDMQQSITYAYRHDVVVVAAAGDDPGPVVSPANCPGVIAVGGEDGTFTPWSKAPSGPQIDFVAPAVNLVNEELDNTLSGPYPDNAGTSQAAAIVSGTFALLRARFPHESARQIVTRALYNVHNGLGGKIFAKRIDDYRGYGEILPYYALTEAPPAGAKNPIYDAADAALGPEVGVSTATAASTTPVGTPGRSRLPAAASSGGSRTSIPPILIVGILAALVALGIVVAALASRRRRPTPAAGHAPLPGHWQQAGHPQHGHPPQGYSAPPPYGPPPAPHDDGSVR